MSILSLPISFVNNESSSKEDPKNLYPIRSLFKLFEKCALDPLNEIYGRLFWHLYYPGIPYDLLTEDRVDNYCSRCGNVFAGLMLALHGKNYVSTVKQKLINSPDLFTSLAKQIQENGKKNLQSSKNLFFSYGFELYCSQAHSPGSSCMTQFSGHSFVVIQYANKKNQLRYRFFQSFIHNYFLKDFLGWKKNRYNDTEFLTFLQGLQKFSMLKTLGDEEVKFHKTYFHVTPKPPGIIKHIFPEGISLFVRWKENNMEHVITLQKEFDDFKTSSYFPKSFLL